MEQCGIHSVRSGKAGPGNKFLIMMLAIGMVTIGHTTFLAVQTAWCVSDKETYGHSSLVKEKEREDPQSPKNPFSPPHPNGGQDPPVITPPITDPEIVVTPPVIDPEIVAPPGQDQPKLEDSGRDEHTRGLAP